MLPDKPKSRRNPSLHCGAIGNMDLSGTAGHTISSCGNCGELTVRVMRFRDRVTCQPPLGLLQLGKTDRPC